MIEPAEYDPKETPAVSLAGKQWPIPPLAVRQWRKIAEPLKEMNARLIALPPAERLTAFDALSTEELDRLIIEPVYYALTRAHQKLTMEQFLDMPATRLELILAWPIVQKQSGLFIAIPDGDAPGEAVAAQAQSQTGI